MEGPHLHAGAAHVFGAALGHQGLGSGCRVSHDGNETDNIFTPYSFQECHNYS